MPSLSWHCVCLASFLLLICAFHTVQAAKSKEPKFDDPTIPSNDTLGELIEPLTQNELSRQSVFWALLTIALANMVDAPGTVYGFPKELTCYLKFSPMICVLDIFCTLFMTIELASRPRSEQSRIEVLHQIARRKIGSSGHALNPLQRRIRVLLFVFGALPQAAKLFACNGITTTQVASSCYLASFVFDEILLFFARERQATDSANVSWDLELVKEARIFFVKAQPEFGVLLLVVLVMIQSSSGKLDLSFMTTFTWPHLFGWIIISCYMVRYYIERTSEIRQSDGTSVIAAAEPRYENDDNESNNSWTSTMNAVMSATTITAMVQSFFGIVKSICSQSVLEADPELLGALALVNQIFPAVWYTEFRRPTDPPPQPGWLQHQTPYIARELAGAAGISIISLLWLSGIGLVFLVCFYGFMRHQDSIPLAIVFILTILVHALVMVTINGWVNRLLTLKLKTGPCHNFPLLFYCCISILAFCLYYRWEYDPAMTYKPSWTKWLG